MARIIDIALGGRVWQVDQLPVGAEARWRETARPLVEPLSELVMAAKVAKPTVDQMVRLAFTSALFVDAAALLDAVCAYSPQLAASRTWLEEHAYSDEVLAALLALFFGMTPSPTAAASATNGALTGTISTS